MKNTTEIICILDRSGSMQNIKNDAIGGFNSFVDQQKKDNGEAKLSLYLFDDQYDIIYEGKDLKEVETLTEKVYFPRNSTALYDAIGRTINTIGARFAQTKEEERPDKVIFLIITDGEENSSKEFKQEQIKDMIEHQKSVYSWQFIFVGANQDSVLAAKNIGISSNNSMFFASTSASVNQTFGNLSKSVLRSRSYSGADYSATLDSALNDDEKDAR